MNSTLFDKVSLNFKDSFLADIFAEKDAIENTNLKFEELSSKDSKPWNQKLDKLGSCFNLTNLLDFFPENYFQNIESSVKTSIQKLIQQSIDISLENCYEMVGNSQPKDSVWLILENENHECKVFLEFDVLFVSQLIYQLLDEENNSILFRKGLTRSEIYVFEFFILNVLFELNNQLPKPILTFQEVTQINPFQSDKYFVSVFEVNSENLHGKVKTYFCLKEFTDNSSKINKNKIPKSAANYQIAEINSRLLVSEIELPLEEIKDLEKSDVILLNQSNLSLINNTLCGKSTLFIGERNNIQIIGRLASLPNLNQATNSQLLKKLNISQPLEISIESFANLHLQEEKPMLETNQKQSLEDIIDKKISENLETEKISLESLSVKLRIELNSRLLTLEELEKLRVGHALKLGCRATDPVNLLINDKIIARGELIEIEENLGVKITQILS